MSFSQTLPSRGMMRSGKIYEQVMSEHRTSDKEYLFLPTPLARDYKEGTAPHYRNGVVQTDSVARAIFNSGEVSGRNLGKYQPAVDRWVKVTGRDYPDPVSHDGRDGGPRLNVDFVSWMMGLPGGWLDADSVGRKDKMILCGNGVVPQQAEAAINELLIKIGVKSD